MNWKCGLFSSSPRLEIHEVSDGDAIASATVRRPLAGILESQLLGPTARLAASVVILAAGAGSCAGVTALSLSLLQTKQASAFAPEQEKALTPCHPSRLDAGGRGRGVNAYVAAHHDCV